MTSTRLSKGMMDIGPMRLISQIGLISQISQISRIGLISQINRISRIRLIAQLQITITDTSRQS